MNVLYLRRRKDRARCVLHGVMNANMNKECVIEKLIEEGIAKDAKITRAEKKLPFLLLISI
jgi:hypothetical protein